MVTELMPGGDVEGVVENAPDHRVPLRTEITKRSAGVKAFGTSLSRSQSYIRAREGFILDIPPRLSRQHQWQVYAD